MSEGWNDPLKEKPTTTVNLLSETLSHSKNLKKNSTDDIPHIWMVKNIL